MKRSRTVHLVLVASAAASLESCGRQSVRRCVDENNVVMDDRICKDTADYPPSHGYHFYYGGPGGYVPIGSRVSGGAPAPGEGSGTVRGIFGAAGEAAHGGGGEGAGE